MRRILISGLSLSAPLILVFLTFSCQTRNSHSLFELRSSSHTSIDFNNRITLSKTLNAVTFEYLYNGGGVAAGDVNQDGRPDLYFTGNMVSSRLYINKGKLEFEDVTEVSNTGTDRWCTGVSMVDINKDGLLDIYICVIAFSDTLNSKNMFLINQGLDNSGTPKFIDKSTEMGLDDEGYSTTGVFFDYDRDGDLDLYLLTNALESFNRNVLHEIQRNGEASSTDRLYMNNGDGTFSNVSKESGITIEGYGLGACAADVNMDGWTDIYVSNDFISNDLLWINQKDGTFRDMSGNYIKEFTNSGMGMDISDFNNDGLPDISVLDMLPYTNDRQKIMIAQGNHNKFAQSIEKGYHPQFLRNTLQMNLGQFPDGTFRFSEIGTMAGISSTDWSWSILFADYDNDGWKDVFISNGYRKDVTNLDYLVYGRRFNNMFGTNEALEKEYMEEMLELPDVKLPNFIFKNNRDLTFTDKSIKWGLNKDSFSNGSVFIDLDNDGDLDLVSNNIDDEVFVYENNLNKYFKNGESHYLRIDLKNQENPSLVFNAKIWVYVGGQMQYIEYTPYRGYKSTMIQPVHFGIGKSHFVDSLIVQWPDESVNKLYSIKTDTLITINHDQAKLEEYLFNPVTETGHTLVYDVTDKHLLKHEHLEVDFDEFLKTYTIPHKQSMYGPSIAVGDINGDGLDDIFTGGDRDQKGIFMIQQSDGKFGEIPFHLDPEYEDMGSLLFDFDNDNDLDLYIVSGGSMFREETDMYQDRLYINDGKGIFMKSEDVLPQINSSGSCVIATDFDKDHDLDLFVGGRLIPDKYPYPPRSYLLENDNGKFKDITGQVNEELKYPGMISSALWTDFNNDSEMDLIICGEWMPIRLFLGNRGTLTEYTVETGLEDTNGWWNSISTSDINNDGWTDYIVGNKGTNSFYNPSKDYPLEIYSKDFDLNGTTDPVMTHYIGETKYIIHPRKLLIDQIPAMNGRFKRFSTYASANFDQSFHPVDLEGAYSAFASTFQSVILVNKEGVSFDILPLPNEAQISPVFGTKAVDINEDPFEDLLITGNSSAEETLFGYQTSFYGQILINKGGQDWSAPKPSLSKFIVDGDARALASVAIQNSKEIFVGTKNNGPVYAFAPLPSNDKFITIGQYDSWATIGTNSTTKKIEFHHGSGYLSQNSRKLGIPNNAIFIIIYDLYGDIREEFFY